MVLPPGKLLAFAMSGVPLLVAMTYALFATARRASRPGPSRISWKVAVGPIAVLSAMRGLAPPFSAVTYLPLTTACNAT